MVDFVTGAKALAIGVSALKELIRLEKEFDQATLKLRIAELSTALATAQITLSEAESELAKKDAEIVKLQENFKLKSEMVEHRGFYYRKGPDEQPRGRAYCPRCLDKGIVMMTAPTQGRVGRPTECPECKREYHANSFAFE